jgi:hypothetical protein
MLRLPARTRSSGEKCRGVWYASLGEESAVREREKKGGMVVMGRHPFIGGRGGAGARGWRGVVPHGGRKRGGSRWRMERGGSDGRDARAAELGCGWVAL